MIKIVVTICSAIGLRWRTQIPVMAGKTIRWGSRGLRHKFAIVWMSDGASRTKLKERRFWHSGGSRVEMCTFSFFNFVQQCFVLFGACNIPRRWSRDSFVVIMKMHGRMSSIDWGTSSVCRVVSFIRWYCCVSSIIDQPSRRAAIFKRRLFILRPWTCAELSLLQFWRLFRRRAR